MITFTYRWKIPCAEEDRFVADWTELTEVAKKEYGAEKVTLYKSDSGDFVAIAEWPSAEAWRLWKERLTGHPLRQHYRKYQIAGPELLFPLVTVSHKGLT